MVFSKGSPETRIEKTRDLVAAAIGLHELYGRVLVRNKNIVWHPIRLERKRLQHLEPYIVWNAPEFDAQLLAWNREGGMMLYDRAYLRSENIAGHDAQLVVECPLDMEMLDAYAEGTRDHLVIYQPPNWDEHRSCVLDLHPSEARCRQFFDLVQAGPEVAQIRETLKLAEGFHVLSDERAAAVMKLNGAQLWRIRSAIFRKRDLQLVTQLVTRIEPEENTLAGIYAYIVNTFPEVNGVRLIPGNALGRATRFWKAALKALARCGAIEMRDTLYCYWLDPDYPPHWFKIAANHRRAEKRLEEMLAYVERLPEFNPPG
jgi:hypothetical protein